MTIPDKSNDAESLLAQGVKTCRAGNFVEGLGQMQSAIALQPGNWRYHYLLGAMLEESGQLKQAVAATQKAIELKKDEPNSWFALAELYLKNGDMLQARKAYTETLALAPEHPQALESLWKLNRREVKAWHFSMMNDVPRNEAYENGIKAWAKDKVVLEIGVGSGLLSMMAARAGAKHVYACEMVPVIAQKAREIVKLNGFADRITIISKPSFELQVAADELPEKADMLITETFDPNLIGEFVLAIVSDARERLLKPGAMVVPVRAKLMGMLVDSRELYEQTAIETASGFDLSPFNEFKVMPGIVVTANNYAFTPLGKPFEIVGYDLEKGDVAQNDIRFEMPVSQNGTCHGLLNWIRLEMGEGSVYECSPLNPENKPKLHWLHALHTWEKPFTVTAGEHIAVHGRYTPKQFVFSRV